MSIDSLSTITSKMSKNTIYYLTSKKSLHKKLENEFFKKYLSKIKEINEKISIITEKKIFSIPSASTRYRLIKLPICFLLEKKDLPEEFQIENPNDPRLSNNDFLKKFYAWITSYFSVDITQIENKYDSKLSKTLLIFLNDSKKSSLAKLFIIYHELSHIMLRHSIQSDQNFASQLFVKRNNEKEADEQALYYLEDNGKKGCEFLFKTLENLPFSFKIPMYITHGTFHTRISRQGLNHLRTKNITNIFG